MECLKDKTGWRLLLGRVQGCGFCMYHMFRVWGYSCLNKKNGWPLFFWNVPHTHFLNPNSALLYLLPELQYISPSPVPSLPIHPVYTITIYFPKAQIQSPHFPTWCFFHSAVSSPQCSNQDLYRSKSYPHLQASLLGSHPHRLQLFKVSCTSSLLCLCPWYFLLFPPLVHQKNPHSSFKTQSNDGLFICEVSLRSLEIVTVQSEPSDIFAHIFLKIFWVYLRQTDDNCWEEKSQQIEKTLQRMAVLQLVLYIRINGGHTRGATWNSLVVD